MRVVLLRFAKRGRFGTCALMLAAAAAFVVACSEDEADRGTELDASDVGKTSADPEPLAEVEADVEMDAPKAARPRELPVRTGAALVRSLDGGALFLADEDHAALRRIPVPLPEKDGEIASLALPGRPAAALAIHGHVLVTVRDPGTLLVVDPDPDASDGGMKIARSIPVAPDAWGLAVTNDERTALVTSAWSHRVTAVDLPTGDVKWSVDVGREPRGIVVSKSGDAWVSHLTSRTITRLEHADGASAPDVETIDLPAGRLRAPRSTSLEASLGYALVLSPDESRLFAPRHALGAQALESWFGTASVDVLLTKSKAPLAPERATVEARDLGEFTMQGFIDGAIDVEGAAVLTMPDLVQPRAAIYREKTKTLLVAGEGSNTVIEVDALAIDPTLSELRSWTLGEREPARTTEEWKDPYARPIATGGAPSAIALSSDERLAYVYCRTTNEIVPIELDGEASSAERPARLRIADDELSYEAARGRRIFFDATDGTVSGGLACAGCHPDGRDDGHVWHELSGDTNGTGFRARPNILRRGQTELGRPRQTPMLAGRVKAYGPYGWKAESPMLEDRVRESFGLHRWFGGYIPGATMDRPKLLVAYLREGLVTPPREQHAPTAEELRGKELFEDAQVGCASCHVPKYDFTDRVAYELARSAEVPGYLTEEDRKFKTPSLLFIDGTAPYFHDGRAKTLEQALFENGNSMGKTSHLGAEDRAALLAYVRSL